MEKRAAGNYPDLRIRLLGAAGRRRIYLARRPQVASSITSIKNDNERSLAKNTVVFRNGERANTTSEQRCSLTEMGNKHGEWHREWPRYSFTLGREMGTHRG